MVYVEEKVRKIAFKAFVTINTNIPTPLEYKTYKKYIFDKTACQTLNSVSRMIN